MASEKGLPKSDVLGVLSFVCNMTKEQVFCHLDRPLQEKTLQRARECLVLRRKGKPLSYITGVREFYSETFFVSEDVLIPRPETEVLVEEALKIIGARKRTTILDMGAGSGAIGIILAKLTGNRVVCVDISPPALKIAALNAKTIGVSRLVHFIGSDLFAAMSNTAVFDMIVANLPYIATDEWEALMTDVKGYEPPRALCGGPGGLEVYGRFVLGLKRHLRHDGGHVLVEIGSASQARTVADMLIKEGLTVRTRKDYADRERVLVSHG